jgi:hypothetical protein
MLGFDIDVSVWVFNAEGLWILESSSQRSETDRLHDVNTSCFTLYVDFPKIKSEEKSLQEF